MTHTEQAQDGESKDPAAQAKPLAPGLYVVATPIGHLRDITLRALDVLKAADTIVCEDSRVSATLARAYGIATPMTAYHDHSDERVRHRLLQALESGKRLALISDAGTPLIADPGFKLVRAARAAGLAVYPVPGPSAAIAALSVGGLPTDRFVFAGFLPAKAKARDAALTALKSQTATLVIYESARRTADTLRAMAEIFGPREAVLARELTKSFETVKSAPLDALAQSTADDPLLKGEVVLLVAGAAEAPGDADRMDALLAEALDSLSTREAAAAVAWTLGLPRRQVYQRALALKRDD